MSSHGRRSPDSTLPACRSVNSSTSVGPVRDSSRNSASPSRASPASSRSGSAAEPRLGVHHPVVGHHRQRTERVVRRQVDGPDRPEQVGDDDMLLGLGASAQLGPGTAPLEQHRGGVGVAVRPTSGPGGARCSNTCTSTAPRPPSAASPSASCSASVCVPRHLEHDLASVAVRCPARPTSSCRPARTARRGRSSQRAVSSSTRSGSAASHAARAGPPTSVEACR